MCLSRQGFHLIHLAPGEGFNRSRAPYGKKAGFVKNPKSVDEFPWPSSVKGDRGHEFPKEWNFKSMNIFSEGLKWNLEHLFKLKIAILYYC